MNPRTCNDSWYCCARSSVTSATAASRTLVPHQLVPDVVLEIGQEVCDHAAMESVSPRPARPRSRSSPGPPWQSFDHRPARAAQQQSRGSPPRPPCTPLLLDADDLHLHPDAPFHDVPPCVARPGAWPTFIHHAAGASGLANPCSDVKVSLRGTGVPAMGETLAALAATASQRRCRTGADRKACAPRHDPTLGSRGRERGVGAPLVGEPRRHLPRGVSCCAIPGRHARGAAPLQPAPTMQPRRTGCGRDCPPSGR
jgi:hypothetical protein